VVNFFGCGWIWLLVLLLGHFPFGLEEYGIIPRPMVCVLLMEHAIQRSILVSPPCLGLGLSNRLLGGNLFWGYMFCFRFLGAGV
jgi:hypothetical protein